MQIIDRIRPPAGAHIKLRVTLIPSKEDGAAGVLFDAFGESYGKKSLPLPMEFDSTYIPFGAVSKVVVRDELQEIRDKINKFFDECLELYGGEDAHAMSKAGKSRKRRARVIKEYKRIFKDGMAGQA